MRARSRALILSAQARCELSLFGGSVTGKYTKLSPPNELVFTWKMKEWSVESTVTIKLESVDESSTKLTLTQTNVPHLDSYENAGQVAKVEQGWQNYYWSRIQKIATPPFEL